MSTLDAHTPEVQHAEPTGPTAPPPLVIGVQTKRPGMTFETVTGIVRRWKREDFTKSGSLTLTGLAFLFSLLSFIVMAANNRGDGMDFNRFEPYRYVLAIAIMSTVYTGGKALRQAQELLTGKRLFQQRTSALLDFFGDQIMAYLLISAASSAVPLLNLMRKATDYIYRDSSTVAFVDTLAASISMAFLAFFALALSAMISGYKLSTKSYI
ncbi:CASP-like protein 4B1 [Alnus glutinosa]|uniref:CASP-like protein 4B1 n=1 Tax=Alnus glutinosa TaxID=3517 RepID=UPI002D79D9C0|nr:CASP-like protein 4B1 [Alnus glutinosa]